MSRNRSRSPNKYQSSFLLHFSSNLYSDLWALMTSQVSKRDQSKYDICTTVMPSFIRHDSFRWASMSLVMFRCYLLKVFFILRNLAETLSENCKDCVISKLNYKRRIQDNTVLALLNAPRPTRGPHDLWDLHKCSHDC